MTASPEANSSETQARRLESVYSQLTTLLHRPDVAQRLRTAPGNDEWSALQVLGHLGELGSLTIDYSPFFHSAFSGNQTPAVR